MKTIKRRYFNENGKYLCEEIAWVLAGTSCVPMGSNLCVAIGTQVNHPKTGMPLDSWQPVLISNPAFEIPPQTVVSELVEIQNLDGTIGSVERVKEVLDSPQIDAYNLPLKPGWVEITKEEYNQGIST